MRLMSGFAAAGLALLAACHTPEVAGDDAVAGEGPAMSIEEHRARSLAEIDQEACAAKGGEVRQDGMMGLYYCIVPYADAGKLCSDAADCLGRCKASDEVTDYEAAPGEAKGQCEANNSKFGCYAVIEGGTAGPFVCVD